MSINPAVYADMTEQLQAAPAPVLAQVPDAPVRVKRTGARPLSFNGTSLVSVMSYAPGTTLWYEVNVYKASDGGFVLDIRKFTKSDDEREHFRAETFATLSELTDYLEGYETAYDIDPSFVDLQADELSGADLALGAARLRLRLEEARSQFTDIVGQILFKLDGLAH